MPWKPRKSPISKMQVVLIQVNSDFRVALPLMQRLTSDVALLHDDSYKSIAHDQWHGMGWQLLEMTWSLSHQNVSWHQTAADRVCNHAFDWLCAFILLLKLFYGYLYLYTCFYPIFSNTLLCVTVNGVPLIGSFWNEFSSATSCWCFEGLDILEAHWICQFFHLPRRMQDWYARRMRSMLTYIDMITCLSRNIWQHIHCADICLH